MIGEAELRNDIAPKIAAACVPGVTICAGRNDSGGAARVGHTARGGGCFVRGYPFLTPPGDALALAAMLLAVIGDPARTAAQARLQQGRFAAGFTVQRMADDTAKAYLRALTLRDERAGKAAMKTGESVGFVGTDGMAARHL